MTVLLGPVPCIACKAPVTVVRREVVIRGTGQACGRDDHTGCATTARSRELREVVTIDGARQRHECAAISNARATGSAA